MKNGNTSTLARLVVCVSVFWSFTTALSAKSLAEACEDVRRELAQEHELFAADQEHISVKRMTLRQDMSDVQAEIRKTSADIAELEKMDANLTRDIHEAEQKLFEFEQLGKRLRETVAFNLSEFHKLYRQVFPRHEAFERAVDTLAANDATITDMVAALNVGLACYNTFFEKASSVEKLDDTFFDESGGLVAARVLRVGLIGGVYWNETGQGIAFFQPGSDRLHLLGRGLTRTQRAMLVATETQRSGDIAPVHLDLSQGMALSQLQLRKDWKAFVDSGGYVMYPLILIAIIAVLMIVERLARFALYTTSFAVMKRKVLDALSKQDFQAAAKAAGAHLGPSRGFWRKTTSLLEKPTAQLEEACQHIVLSEIPAIERFLSSLAVFAAICPLLGLLGTVSGMIKTFEIITLYGTGDSAMLSQGISEALVTTQVGLVLAIPILLAHSFLAKSARSIIGRMDRAVADVADSIIATNAASQP